MSEYELADLFLNTVVAAGNLFLSLVTIMTGFLVVGLFFGQLLDRVMLIIVVGGYTGLILVSGLQVNRAYTSFSNIAFEIRERAAETGELHWHAVVSTPQWFLEAGPYVTGFFVLLGYVGSLIFFFRTRKLDPKDFR